MKTFKKTDVKNVRLSWQAIKTVLYLLFFGFIALSILTAIVILF